MKTEDFPVSLPDDPLGVRERFPIAGQQLAGPGGPYRVDVTQAFAMASGRYHLSVRLLPAGNRPPLHVQFDIAATSGGDPDRVPKLLTLLGTWLADPHRGPFVRVDPR